MPNGDTATAARLAAQNVNPNIMATGPIVLGHGQHPSRMVVLATVADLAVCREYIPIAGMQSIYLNDCAHFPRPAGDPNPLKTLRTAWLVFAGRCARDLKYVQLP